MRYRIYRFSATSGDHLEIAQAHEREFAIAIARLQPPSTVERTLVYEDIGGLIEWAKPIFRNE